MSETAQNNFEEIKHLAEQGGAVKVGIAGIEPKLKRYFDLTPGEFQSWPYAISVAVRLSRAVLESLDDRPTHLYKWHYKQANAVLDGIAFAITNKIQEMGYRALPIAASQILDWKKQNAHVSHRHTAVAAGLGWFGRNNLLVTKEFGAQVRLVTVLTNLPLPAAREQAAFGCGECRRCVDECPVDVLGESSGDFDFDRCFSLLDYFSRKKGIGVMICGLCQKVCPGSTKLW
ncbi:epoxyqueuosine reductase [bacterium BMS3Abin05]|nr:epoxyqueuosine reductase [bacterium BMS3Abin05]GBE26261.1 epoxyqueuosine reductase [bacterium BMS3Bbin03]HDZ12035.1 epoxyqueuosine reductase [Bacteroidota bacterium]